MYKKIILISLLLLFSANIYSQKSNEAKAEEITSEMADILDLNDELRDKVYKIQLKRFNDVESIRSEYVDDLETRRLELKKIYGKLYGKLKGVLGKDLIKEWGDYKKS